MLHGLSLGIVILDAAGEVLYANKGFTEIFGYDSADIRGRSLDACIAHAPEEAAVLTCRAKQGPVAAEVERVAKDGSPLQVVVHGIPFNDGVLGIYTDRTACRSLERQAMIRDFTGVVAHTFNNLLTGILIRVDLHDQECTTNELTKIKESLQKLSEIVQLLRIMRDRESAR